MDANLTVPHIHEFLMLWNRLEGVHLHGDNVDTISWNLTFNGEYSSASAYEAQFFRARLTNFDKMVWKNRATPKVKFFSWLAIWNRLWTVDLLRKGGGKFVAFVHFASKRKRWRLIYFPIVAIPRGYEIWSRTGLAYPLFILMSGLPTSPLRRGG
jgi:hypothetical protein